MKPATSAGSKLALISAVLFVLSLPVWAVLHFNWCTHAIAPPLVVPIVIILGIPPLYLQVYALWHWRTRYAGRHHLAWLIVFVTTMWALLSILPASAFTALAYFVMHVLPDMRETGPYASARPIAVAPPASSLPSSSRLVKSALFVTGWVLVLNAALVAITVCLQHYIVWTRVEYTLPYELGNTLTEAKLNALGSMSEIGKVTVITCMLATLASGAGAGLIHCSERLRPRKRRNKRAGEQRDI